GTTTVSAAFNNTGTVRVTSGGLVLNRGGTDAGTFDLAGGDLTLGAGTHVFNAGTAVTGTGTLHVTTGELTVNADIAVVRFDLSQGGTLDGAAKLTLTGTATCSASVMDGPGTTAVAAGAALTVSGNAPTTLNGVRKFDNFGTVNLTGTGGFSV